MSQRKHDLFAHVLAGGFGIYTNECEACVEGSTVTGRRTYMPAASKLAAIRRRIEHEEDVNRGRPRETAFQRFLEDIKDLLDK